MIESDSGLDARFTLERERGGVVEEPPFRILVLGDWSASSEKRDLNDRLPIDIDRDNFDQVLARISPGLELPQTDGNILELKFSSLDDFHPDRIFERLPMFAKLREHRSKLIDPKTFNEAAREVRSWIKVEEKVAKPVQRDIQPVVESSDNLLDAILSGTAGAAPAPRPARGSDEIATLVSDLVRPHLVSIDENEQAALLAAIDAATSDLMRHILHDRNF